MARRHSGSARHSGAVPTSEMRDRALDRGLGIDARGGISIVGTDLATIQAYVEVVSLATDPDRAARPTPSEGGHHVRHVERIGDLVTIGDPARIWLVPRGTGAPTCELCAGGTGAPTVSVLVEHARGGVVRLAACDECARALRRLAAACDGCAASAVAGEQTLAPAGRRPLSSGARPVGPPVCVREFAERVRDPADGVTYVARANGRRRADGTWEGWVEFAAVGAAGVLRTAQETTQSDGAGVAYWAAGLEPLYLEGAFARARRATAVAPPPGRDPAAGELPPAEVVVRAVEDYLRRPGQGEPPG